MPVPGLFRCSPPALVKAFASVVLAAVAANLAAAPASAPPASPSGANVAAVPMARGEEGVRWQKLTAAQRQALAPLEHEWPGIDAARKQKWIVMAGRFDAMPPAERARISARMAEWAKLTPAERGQARLRFEESKQLPAKERTARWEAYQALPADARQHFAARAASAAASGAEAARRDGLAVKASKPPRDTKEAKANTVPNASLAQSPKPVAPTLVQAAPGATTTSITRVPMPPAHQQAGMPKIAATPEFVNRSTLLPKRGPQAAGVARPPSANPPLAARASAPARAPITVALPQAASQPSASAPIQP